VSRTTFTSACDDVRSSALILLGMSVCCLVIIGGRSEFYPAMIPASLSPNGRASMVIIGGVNGTALGDILQTYDGKTYTQVTAAHTFPARWGGGTLVDGSGKVWMLGGYSGSVYTNDVWYTATSNLAGTWSQMNQASIPWTIRGHLQFLTVRSTGHVDFIQFSGNLIGTQQMYRYFASNSTWSLLNANPPFGGRAVMGVANIGNTYVLIGGTWNGVHYNDIWSSTDECKTFTKYTNNAPW